MILSWREVYHNYNSGTCDGAAYEKFDDGEDCLTQSGRAALVAAVEVPFDLPDGWAWTRIEDIALSIQYGYNASALLHGRIRMVRISDIQEGCIQWDKVPYCNIPESSIGKYLLEKGDILFARTGGTVGKSYLVSSLPKESVYAGYLVRTKCSSKVSTRFVKAFLESSFYWHQLRSGVIATAQPNFSGSKLASLLFPLPPLAEQKRIVAKIEELFAVADALGTAAEGLGNAARQLDRKILDLAIRGKLVPQDPDDEPASELLKRISASSHKSPCKNHGKPINLPFVIPQSWKWVRLGDVSNIVRGSGIKRNETSASGVQCVRYGEIYTHYGESFDKAISFVPQTVADKCHEAKFGDVLCTLTGENEVEIAKATAYLGHEKLVIGGDLARISDHPYVPMLLVYFMYSPFMISQKSSVCTGGMIVHMGKAALSNLYIPLPPLAEQKRIVAKIEELRSMITVLSI